MALPEKSIGVSYSWLVDKAAEVQRRQEDKGQASPSSTIEAAIPSTQEAAPSRAVEDKELWIAEDGGGVFTASRVRIISRAQDAMTHIEEAVYDVLWGVKQKGDPEPYRLVKSGYAELSRKSRVSKRRIQDVVHRLIQKHIVQIEVPADTLRRISTTYRVFSYAAIRKHQKETGRHWVIHTGTGVFYARKLPSTVDARSPSTVDARSSSTVDARSSSTVDVPSTTSLDINTDKRKATTSASVPTVATAFLQAIGRSDDDAVMRLVDGCRSVAPDATEDEIAHFLTIEASRFYKNPRILNLSGLMIVQVPKCFAGDSFRLHRETQRKLRETAEREQQESDKRFHEFQEDQRRTLENPNSKEEDKALARKFLGLDEVSKS